MAETAYREQIDARRITQIREIIRQLPQACGDFLRAIAVTTGTFTRLAYAIDYKTEGWYVLVTFKAPAELPRELERNLEIYDSVIRYLVVKLVEKRSNVKPRAVRPAAPAEEAPTVETAPAVEAAPAEEAAPADAE